MVSVLLIIGITSILRIPSIEVIGMSEEHHEEDEQQDDRKKVLLLATMMCYYVRSRLNKERVYQSHLPYQLRWNVYKTQNDMLFRRNLILSREAFDFVVEGIQQQLVTK